MFQKLNSIVTFVITFSVLLVLLQSCNKQEKVINTQQDSIATLQIEKVTKDTEQTTSGMVPIEAIKTKFLETTSATMTTPPTIVSPTTTGVSVLSYPNPLATKYCKLSESIDDKPVVQDNSTFQGDGPVLSGLDVLEQEHFASLKNKNLGFLVNHSSINKNGKHIIDLLRNEPNIKMKCIFSPEHGLFGNVDTHVSDFVETRTQMQVYSLYGRKANGGKSGQPSKEQLKGIDAVIVDMQDIGARFYTYPAYMAYMMEICATLNIEVIVLDRPNPIGGLYVDGPYQDEDLIGRTTSYIKMPIAHGMTMGELAKLFNEENKINCKLTVVEMKNWKRSMLWDETGLRWVNPSPNIRDLDAALLYPGIGMTERIVSMGRGTTEPFHIIGTPYIDDVKPLIDDVHKNMKGVKLEPISFTPSGTAAAGHVGEGKQCTGVRIVITDRKELRAVELGIRVMSFLNKYYGTKCKTSKEGNCSLLYDVMNVRASCSALTCVQIKELTSSKRLSLDGVLETIDNQVNDFKKTREKYLIYE